MLSPNPIIPGSRAAVSAPCVVQEVGTVGRTISGHLVAEARPDAAAADAVAPLDPVPAARPTHRRIGHRFAGWVPSIHPSRSRCPELAEAGGYRTVDTGSERLGSCSVPRDRNKGRV